MIVDLTRATARVAPTLGQVIGAYKSKVANLWLAECKRQGAAMPKVWQRNYYEHAIRNDRDHRECAEYIQNNPLAWADKNDI